MGGDSFVFAACALIKVVDGVQLLLSAVRERLIYGQMSTDVWVLTRLSCSFRSVGALGL